MKNTYSTEIVKLAKQIKKEHFLKLFLWTTGIALTLIWLAFMIATSISMGNVNVYKGELIQLQIQEKAGLDKAFIYILQPDKYKLMRIYEPREGIIFAEFREIAGKRDMNPLCLVGNPQLTGWYVALLLSPLGYIAVLFIIAYSKNMITPNQVKTTNRKALQFGYLRQREVDMIVDEIDYNIGIKKRPETKNEPETKEIHS